MKVCFGGRKSIFYYSKISKLKLEITTFYRRFSCLLVEPYILIQNRFSWGNNIKYLGRCLLVTGSGYIMFHKQYRRCHYNYPYTKCYTFGDEWLLINVSSFSNHERLTAWNLLSKSPFSKRV